MPIWRLPDHISDILPAEAALLEPLRRQLLDLYASHGYAQFQPPLIEQIQALRVQGASDLDHRSFKLVDPMSGELLGIRPDITPQAARVDAHLLGHGIQRLCYAASTVHALPAGLKASREPIQLGCELFGHAGLEADLEVQALALESLRLAGLHAVHLNLTDRGILQALRASDPALSAIEETLIAALQAKDQGRIEQVSQGLLPLTRSALLALIGLYGPALDHAGGPGLLSRARQVLPGLPQIQAALDRLEAVCRAPLFAQYPDCQISIDLADQQGWRYHNGVMFSIYCAGEPDALIRGGRYDGMGEAFGRARPATGFSLELRSLLALSRRRAGPEAVTTATAVIAAPWAQSADPALQAKVAQLRRSGQAVAMLPPDALQTWNGPSLALGSDGWSVCPAPSA